MYQITSPWEENVATWNKATSTANWKQKAGDHNSQAITPHSFNPSKTLAKWHDIDITSAVRNFVKDPTKNYGVIIVLISKAEAVFNSSENSNIELRPKLTVDYEPVTAISHKTSLKQKGISISKVSQGFNIALKEFKNSDVNLYGVNGVKVKSFSPSQRNFLIPSHLLTKGVYFLKVRNRVTGNVSAIKLSNN